MNEFKEKPAPIELNNYKMLDIIKYALSFMVIYVHCNPVFSNEFLDYFTKNIVCRIAVPFFFMASAYFVRKGSANNPQYVKRYLKGTVKSYLLWSLAFAPIGLDWMRQNLELAGNLLPFALLYGLIHIGTYYHLWYIPALLFSVFFVDKLLRRISYKLLFILSIVLFAFGSIETYYGLLPTGGFKNFFDRLISVIFTTRSGLFYGMIFVLMGFFIYDYREKLKVIIKYVPMLTILSAVLLVLEGTLLYCIPRLDMNFLLGLIPFGFFFFLWVLSFPYRPKGDTKRVRELSKYYYFVHLACFVVVAQIGFAYEIDFLTSGIVSFVLIVLLTHLVSTCIVKMEKPIPYRQILCAIAGGMLITFILVSVILPFKTTTQEIKFELVPCIWFVASFIICYLLSKNSRAKYSYQKQKSNYE